MIIWKISLKEMTSTCLVLLGINPQSLRVIPHFSWKKNLQGMAQRLQTRCQLPLIYRGEDSVENATLSFKLPRKRNETASFPHSFQSTYMLVVSGNFPAQQLPPYSSQLLELHLQINYPNLDQSSMKGSLMQWLLCI